MFGLIKAFKQIGENRKAVMEAPVLYEEANGYKMVDTRQGTLNKRAEAMQEYVLQGKSVGMADDSIWDEL